MNELTPEGEPLTPVPPPPAPTALPAKEQPDVIILGAGWGGLAAATLLAKAGRRVLVLEAQDRAGGCGQSLTRGDFSFCAEMQYLMGCGEGGTVQRWLHDLNLEQTVEFNSLDPAGYDRIDLPGTRFRIPLGPDRFELALREAFPDQREPITQLFAIMWRIEKELSSHGIDLEYLEHHPFEFQDTALYGLWPVARVFEHLKISPRVGAVIAGQCGDLGLWSRDAPFLCLQALIYGYGASAHFPKRGMAYFVEQVVLYLAAHGGSIVYQTPVTRILREGDRIKAVETPRGVYVADLFISNIDPARTLGMIDAR